MSTQPPPQHKKPNGTNEKLNEALKRRGLYNPRPFGFVRGAAISRAKTKATKTSNN